MQTTKGRIIESLGDGLVMRHITPDDRDELVEFNGTMHADPGSSFDDSVAAWTRDMIERPPPGCSLDDFTVVEDTRTGRIVSSVNLISQTWSYDGVPFGVGQVEAVATHPDYRRRGLVRRQFETVHRWSVKRGELMTVVSGIPWYYRQFGYEMCVSHGGGRAGFAPLIPPLPDGTAEPFNVRRATAADAPYIKRVADQAAERYLLTCVRDEPRWRYEIERNSPVSLAHRELRIIERPDGERLGYLAHMPRLRQWALMLTDYYLVPAASWLAVTPSVLRYLAATGKEYAERDGGPCEGYSLGLETEHPAYQAIPNRLPVRGRISTWFIRVPDVARFLLHIAQVMEHRLARSVAAGFSGDLRLDFYRAGLQLHFQDGRLMSVGPWPEHDFRTASASFPDLTFLQLFLGYRTLDELEYAFSDCSVPSEQGRVLLGILFPKRPSFVWQIS
jgi:hypothetical protein